MKRSFQHVTAAVSSAVAAPVAAIHGDRIAGTVPSAEAHLNVDRPRKLRVWRRRTAPSARQVFPTSSITGYPLSHGYTTTTTAAAGVCIPQLSCHWQCDALESALPEEGLLHLVLSFLTFRDHQVVRAVSRPWRQRVRTLAVDRLDVSAHTISLCPERVPRACHALLHSYSRVRRLDVSGQRALGDRDLLLLTSHFWTHLGEVVLDDCQAITDFGLLAVLNARSLRLRSVSLRRCKQVTGRSLVAGHDLHLTGSHPSLTRLVLDDTRVTHAFVLHLEAHFPTLAHLSALHTPAHGAFFQHTSTLRPLLRDLQQLVHDETPRPLLSALLDAFRQWCSSPRRRSANAFERTVAASGARALVDVPLFPTRGLTNEPTAVDNRFGVEFGFESSLSLLLYASASGRTRVLAALFAARSTASSDLEHTDAAGHSALSLAAAHGHVAAARLLLRAGSDVHTRSVALASPLDVASANGWDALVGLLLEADARRGPTALCAAATNGHRAVVRRLLTSAKPVDDRPAAVEALCLACEGGHAAVVLDLLQLTTAHANALLLLRDDCVSPLYLCCQMGHVDVAALLLAQGADPNFQRPPPTGVSCLYIAAQEGHDAIVRLLVRAGADVQRPMAADRSTALHIAARMGRVAVARTLLRCGAQVDAATRSGLTPLFIASDEGHVELVHCLLRAGAARDRQTSGGATALFAAVQSGHLSVLEALLCGGASPAIATYNGTSPLDTAVGRGDAKAAWLLLHFGARVDGAAARTDVVTAEGPLSLRPYYR
ncbi:unnamed protein product [Hyaloperonospora brassicae]|uniref:F-box domain-containing protein n=1 Tax=Hyaloperonospora brassicae TaxID=162125 RepID=A0AAV0ULM5_HYABA|nr:unnamed protein product [Hyaloperonospora brassicae]